MEHHPLALRAWKGLYERAPRHELRVRYHGRFRNYNANVEKRPGTLARPGTILFSLSREFEGTSDEIAVGVMQHLLNRIEKTKIDTLEIQLYNRFIKKLADYVGNDTVDALLKRRFDRLNQEYFDGYMLTPNLVWGPYALTKLGHYEYATDTISISTALKEDLDVLDYVLFHEMLHKKHKFSERAGGFTRSHTKAFKEEERSYRMPDGSDPEKRLAAFLRSRQRRRQGAERSGFLQRLLDGF